MSPNTNTASANLTASALHTPLLAGALEYITTHKTSIPEEYLPYYSALFVRRWKLSYVLSLLESHPLHMLRREGVEYGVIFRNGLSMDTLKALAAQDHYDEHELFLCFREPRPDVGHADMTPRVLISLPFGSSKKGSK